MIRVVIENILLFLLPTVAYIIYVYVGRGQEEAASPGAILSQAPLVWLFLAGALLVIITLVAFGSTSGGRPGQAYEPPAMKDGRIEPGRIR
jgi:hypothetical protein